MIKTVPLVQKVIGKINHDIISPIAALQIDLEENNIENAKKAFSNLLKSINVFRAVASESLKWESAKQISYENMDNIKWNVDSFPKGHFLSNITILLAFILHKKKQNREINISDKKIETHFEIQNVELDALSLKQESQCSYNTYFYLIGLFCKELNYNLSFSSKHICIEV